MSVLENAVSDTSPRWGEGEASTPPQCRGPCHWPCDRHHRGTVRAERDYGISRICASAVRTACTIVGDAVSILLCKRCLATARIWSMTATAACPWQVTGTVMGGCACAAVDSGTTTTVCRKRFMVLVVSTRHGRVLR